MLNYLIRERFIHTDYIYEILPQNNFSSLCISPCNLLRQMLHLTSFSPGCSSMLHEEYTVKRKSFEVKSHKCNQCEYISHKSNNSTWAMSIHSKEKPFE